jgi:hypothetical protein
MKVLIRVYSYRNGAFVESLGNAIEHRTIIEYHRVSLARTPPEMEGLNDYANHDKRINART